LSFALRVVTVFGSLSTTISALIRSVFFSLAASFQPELSQAFSASSFQSVMRTPLVHGGRGAGAKPVRQRRLRIANQRGRLLIARATIDEQPPSNAVPLDEEVSDSGLPSPEDENRKCIDSPSGRRFNSLAHFFFVFDLLPIRRHRCRFGGRIQASASAEM
jgi:hypothetical protein